MKIKFSSAKEHHPTQDQGLQVLYAPGKRLAFRVRWYLILLMVVSPLLWLVGRWSLTLLLIEAPAQLHLPGIELRSRDAAQVQNVLVAPGQRVTTGDLLMRLDNPEWRARSFLLQAGHPTAVRDEAGLQRERELLTRLFNRAEANLQQIERLLIAGAATRGELISAANERDGRLRDLYQLEQRSQPVVDRDQGQREQEIAWLNSRLAGLELRAEADGKIGEIMAAPGENVGPGTPLLRLELEGEPQVWVYLKPSHAASATPGKAMTIIFPDGSKRQATVIQTVDDAAPVPVELRAPFSAPTRSLRVIAQVAGGVPPQWRIDRLGLTARFPERWLPFGS